MNPRLEASIKNLPRTPGVYKFMSQRGELIYIGKATDLRARVRSYFSGTDPRPFVQILDRILGDVEFIVTETPKEALLLENTLIKKHKPRFNFMLRDDKNYLSLRIDTRKEWPRVEIVRSIRNDGAKYFGPYGSASKVRKTVNTLNRFFQLRTCRDSVLRNRARPCLQYQIRRCPGPCVLPVDPETYADNVRHAELFLGGRADELMGELTLKMNKAAEELEFEDAARFRDQMAAIEDSLAVQRTVQTSTVDRDVIGIHRQGESVALTVLRFRAGAMENVRHFFLSDQVVDDDAVVAGLLTQLYADRDEPPREVIVPLAPTDIEGCESALTELRGRGVKIIVPLRGDRSQLLNMACENAEHLLATHLQANDRNVVAHEKLASLLRLKNTPRTIECFDISNIQGNQVVASQVTFVDGQPDKKRYRRYRIRSVDGQDDFASMYEVLSRRAKRAQTNKDPLPDLIVIDGGLGQLGAACSAINSRGLSDYAIIGLAKSRAKGPNSEGETEHSFERAFVPGRKNPIEFRRASDARHLLERVRDEAHRFAITYHRESRRRETLRSELDGIPGVGAARRTLLLNHFRSARSVRNASLTELETVPGLPKAVAWSVFDYFHPGESDAPAD